MRGLFAVAAALAASCGFATRSDEFACDGEDGCPDGRSCVSGWCVSEEGLPDATDQPEIDCPPDEPCVIVCDEPGSCAGGIDCQQASSCDITCSGIGSCSGHIECEGSGPCNVVCSGDLSCAGSIDCDDACACDISCDGDGSCQSDVDCPFTGQCRDGKECDSGNDPSCDTC